MQFCPSTGARTEPIALFNEYTAFLPLFSSRPEALSEVVSDDLTQHRRLLLPCLPLHLCRHDSIFLQLHNPLAFKSAIPDSLASYQASYARLTSSAGVAVIQLANNILSKRHCRKLSRLKADLMLATSHRSNLSAGKFACICSRNNNG